MWSLPLLWQSWPVKEGTGMKKRFTEPRLELEAFAVQDSTLFLSDFETGEDELDPAYGNTPAIG